jgi:O-antigen ligase
MGITLGLYLLTTTKEVGKRVFLWIGLLLMFLNIYKTSSRGPWLAVILSFGFFLLLGHNRLRKYLVVLAALTVLVLVIRPGVWDTLANIYYGTVDPTSPLGSSYEYRYALRHVATKAVSQSTERAIWGYGLESFYGLHLQGELNGKPYAFLSCDSAWLELLVETGYVGLVIISSLLIAPAWNAWKDFGHLRSPDRYLSLTLLVTMVTFYFMMLSVAMYAWGQNGYMLWILIATSLAYGRLKRSEFARARIENSKRTEQYTPAVLSYCTEAVRPWKDLMPLQNEY